VHKLGEFHSPLRFDALVVEVGVKEDRGEGKEEHGVWSTEYPHHFRVTTHVLTGKRLEDNTHTHIQYSTIFIFLSTKEKFKTAKYPYIELK